MLTADALAHPAAFLVDFAARHHLPVAIHGEHSARRLKPLSSSALETVRKIVLDAGGQSPDDATRSWTLQERIDWCLIPTGIHPLELHELYAVADAVASDAASPARALARHRLGVPLADLGHSEASPWRDPEPLPDDDVQVMRLALLQALVFSRFGPTSDWMTKWSFYRPGRRHTRVTSAIRWIRMCLDHLADIAAIRVSDAARAHRDRFFAAIDPDTCPVPVDVIDFWALGYGEVSMPAAEVAAEDVGHRLAGSPVDPMRIALSGDMGAIHDAFREAGTAALRWPWILKVLDGLREAAERAPKADRARARERLETCGKMLGRAHGSGRDPEPKGNSRSAIAHALHTLRAHLSAVADGHAPDPPRELLDLGAQLDASHEERRRTGRLTTREARLYRVLDEEVLRSAAAGVNGTSVSQRDRIARILIAGAFSVTLATVARRVRDAAGK